MLQCLQMQLDSVSRTVYATRSDGGSTAPGTPPDWMYNFSTNTWTASFAVWSFSPGTVDVDGEASYWQGTVTATEASPNANTATGVFSNVARGFQFDSVVTFTNGDFVDRRYKYNKHL